MFVPAKNFQPSPANAESLCLEYWKRLGGLAVGKHYNLFVKSISEKEKKTFYDNYTVKIKLFFFVIK
jgi:hypothetical protein